MKKTAFIIGTGPSLRDIDVTKLKDYTTMTFNRAYISYEEWGFEPKYYMCIDQNDLNSYYSDVNKLVANSSTEKFFLCDLSTNAHHSPVAASEKITILHDTEVWPYHGFSTFYDIPEEHTTKRYGNEYITKVYANAGAMGVRVLHWMGYNEIAFVGCDCRYRDDEESNKFITQTGKEYTSHANYDVNHYRNDYFGEGVSFGKPNQKEQLFLWDQVSQAAARIPGFNVYSCTKNSNANRFFEYIDFEDFLEGKRDGEKGHFYPTEYNLRRGLGHVGVRFSPDVMHLGSFPATSGSADKEPFDVQGFYTK